MKRTHAKPTEPAGQSVFHKVAENLYRLESSGGYYALVKKGDKQFRRSLKTKDRKLADRHLKELNTGHASLWPPSSRDVMLQLRYRNVSDAREEPNLMVDEEQSGIVRREPFLVCFLFHSFVWFVAPFQL